MEFRNNKKYGKNFAKEEMYYSKSFLVLIVLVYL